MRAASRRHRTAPSGAPFVIAVLLALLVWAAILWGATEAIGAI